MLAPALTELLLIETTTLGVRRYAVARTALARETTPVETRYGQVAIKIALHHGRPLRCKPEYEDCKRLALEQGVPIPATYAAVQAALATQGLAMEPSGACLLYTSRCV